MNKEERKEFRALMWEFRRAPESLTEEERHNLDKLFEKLPALRTLYHFRLRFKEIFDTAPDRETAARWLRKLREEMAESVLDFSSFWVTYENWKTEILNYFDNGYTSAAVEGVNNKARVIIKRSYGIKSTNTLWNRLLLDLNLAAKAVGKTIEQMRGLVTGLTAIFC
ncbi:MAG: transposase [Terriglobales bacterium]